MSGGDALRRRIIIVDDDPAICALVADCLKSLGYRVASVADRSGPLHLDLDDDIDVIGDGVGMAAWLGQAPFVRRIKLVAEPGDLSRANVHHD